MRTTSFFSFIAMTISLGAQSQSTLHGDSSIHFAGTTPCSNVIRPLHKIKPEADCELKECKCVAVEWKLILYRSSVTGEPTTYKLTGINRFSVPETNLLSQPGTKTESEGKWTLVNETNSEATVYRINPDKPEISLTLVKLGDNLLHVLDHEGRLMIGNEYWSYTLTRLKKGD